ncbi:DUF4249 domain-containing protein [Adhaeribacter sp. BT258]|uniref:DUF4249 domain-containing protein n=1 Tax=Adhaeribacter terrigena TaxID=2793070 RepID=A0ABS1C3S7_9BACT|nr:DUF4249 domain-containing protein [Adhaeribacter terrigena]MBK0404049.1 DUF4249 domain-containing protein [Adhaeribacter terrigena]
MLQKTAQLAAAFLAVISFSACETVVEVPIPAHTPKLAVRYMLPDQEPDTLFYQLFPQYQPYINHSQSIYSGAELKGVNDAMLTVTDQHGNVVETFKRSNGFGYGASDDGYYEPVTRFKAQPGQKYTLSVSAPNYETVTGKLTMPSALSGLRASFQKISAEEPGGNFAIVQGRVSISLPDNGSENNYYVLYGVLLDDRYVANGRDVFQEETDEDAALVGNEFQNIHFSPILYGDANPFDDKTFNGNTVSFTRKAMLYYGKANTPPRYLRIYVHSITEDTFKFLKSLKMYNDNGNNPFAEQTRVLGNLEKGYGYFGGFTSTYFDIELPK